MVSGFFALFDDVATLLDDAAMMTKVAAKKTAGLLGDDLAVNAEKATGFNSSRELLVIWAIAKGSFLNKVIILPFAFLLSAFAAWLIVPILLVGGTYLCYEGVEKIIEWLFHKDMKKPAAASGSNPEHDQAKIKSAIRTDFILSIEIIVISLGTVLEQTLVIQFVVVSLIALLATVGVYGLVALIVRMDDTGFSIIEYTSTRKGMLIDLLRRFGFILITLLPKVIYILSIIGTFAMLVVGGGMFVHNIEAIHHLLESLPPVINELSAGILVGLIAVAVMHMFQYLRK